MVEISSIIQTGIGAVAGAGLSLSDTWQAIVGDRIAAWRLSNAAKLQPKVMRELKAAGLTLNQTRVPDRYAFAWFEEATKQDEDEIQTLFAKLLSQAAAGNTDASDRRLLSVVGQLTPVDAHVFQRVYATANWDFLKTFRSHAQTWITWQIAQIADDIDKDGGRKSIEHLTTIGLLNATFSIKEKFGTGGVSYNLDGDRVHRSPELELKDQFTSTAIGISLYLAIHPETLAGAVEASA